jgi:hypothetical protein
MKTVKLLAAAIVLTLGIQSAKAQTANLEFGIKAGVSFSTLKTGLDAVTDKSGKMGFNGGVFARAGKTVFFQPEVNYVNFSDTYKFNSATYKAKFSQVNVPLLVGYKIINTADLNLRVAAGPDLYYNLKKPAAPSGLKYKDFSTGAALNAGVDIGNLTIDARYSLGLSKVSKELGQKANIFSVGVGFKFQ